MTNGGPLFSIGIPTYNRCQLLQEALASACAQSYAPLEIIISDNASTDGTEAYVSALNDPRVRYVRHPVNRGGPENFVQCVEQARGEYFSWLQDDDILFSDFACRATTAFEHDREAVGYLAVAVHAENPRMLYNDRLFPTAYPLDWIRGSVAVVPPTVIQGVAPFASFAIPPVMAFRTAALRRIVRTCFEPSCQLYHERLLLSAIATQGKMLAVPFIAGIFRAHAEQAHVPLLRDPIVQQCQWTVFIEHWYRQLRWKGDSSLALRAGSDKDGIFEPPLFAEYLRTLPLVMISQWACEVASWPLKGSGLSREASELLQTVGGLVAEELSARNGGQPTTDLPTQRSSTWKNFLRDVTPPLLERNARRILSIISKPNAQR